MSYATKQIAGHYLDAVVFTEEEELGDASFSHECFERAQSVCAEFLNQCEFKGLDISELTWEQLGHDIWFTRNGHGVGFWDRGLGELGEQLSTIAKEFGEVWAYVGDDNLIYFTNEKSGK